MKQPGCLVACWMTLAMAVSAGGADAQERLSDLPRLVASLDLTERGVRRWLEQLGANAGAGPTERLLALSPTGERLMERIGGKSSVRVDAELDQLLLRPGMATVLVHNHPTSVGLSGPDIGQLAKPGVTAVVALGHDGSVFMASAGARLDPILLEEQQYALARAEVTKRLRAEWPSGSVSVAVSDTHLSHLVTLALAKAGIIQYWFALRGTSRESYEGARLIFNRVVLGAAGRLRNK